MILTKSQPRNPVINKRRIRCTSGASGRLPSRLCRRPDATEVQRILLLLMTGFHGWLFVKIMAWVLFALSLSLYIYIYIYFLYIYNYTFVYRYIIHESHLCMEILGG